MNLLNANELRDGRLFCWLNGDVDRFALNELVVEEKTKLVETRFARRERDAVELSRDFLQLTTRRIFQMGRRDEFDFQLSLARLTGVH